MPIASISKRFGMAVRQRRMAAGLSQERLAERAGLHPTYVSMVERAVRNPTLDVSAGIAEALQGRPFQACRGGTEAARK